MEYKVIAVESLLLDTLNPRHNPVESRREALAALLEGKSGQEVLRLAEDISKFGLSPIDLALVVPDGNLYIVLEGNRRVAALKLLRNPGLATGSNISNAIYELSKHTLQIDSLGCIVSESREEARRWIELRHMTNHQGVGVVSWSPEMQVRFSENYSGQRGKALRLTDALEEAYADDAELLELIHAVKAAKITTLGRLVSDPAFTRATGLVIDDQVQTRFSAARMREFWNRLLNDLSTQITVSDLKNKQQRADYLAGLSEVTPDRSERRPVRRLEEVDEENETESKDQDDTQPRKSPARTQRSRPTRLFHDLRLQNVQPKVRDVLREAQRIDLRSFPNAGAILIRVTVELVVTEGIEYINPQADDRLRDRIKLCLRELDPSQNNADYAGVRSGLADPNSLFAVRVMHSYLHNAKMHADAASLRAISENYVPFLRGVDRLIGERRI